MLRERQRALDPKRGSVGNSDYSDLAYILHATSAAESSVRTTPD